MTRAPHILYAFFSLLLFIVDIVVVDDNGFWLWCQCIAYEIRHKSNTHVHTCTVIDSIFSTENLFAFGPIFNFTIFVFAGIFSTAVLHTRAQVRTSYTWKFPLWFACSFCFNFIFETPKYAYGFYLCHRIFRQVCEKKKQKTKQDDQNEGSPDNRSLLSLSCVVVVFSIQNLHCIVLVYCRSFFHSSYYFHFAFYQLALNWIALKFAKKKAKQAKSEQREFKMKWKRHQCCRRRFLPMIMQ